MYENEHYLLNMREDPLWIFSFHCGINPSRSTLRRWISCGINDVRLRATTDYSRQTTRRWVIEFVYALNDRTPHFEAYLFDMDYFPIAIEQVARQVLESDLDPKQLAIWRLGGVNGVKLDVLKVGKYLLTTPHDFKHFLEAAGIAVPNAKTKRSHGVHSPSSLKRW